MTLPSHVWTRQFLLLQPVPCYQALCIVSAPHQRAKWCCCGSYQALTSAQSAQRNRNSTTHFPLDFSPPRRSKYSATSTQVSEIPKLPHPHTYIFFDTFLSLFSPFFTLSSFPLSTFFFVPFHSGDIAHFLFQIPFLPVLITSLPFYMPASSPPPSLFSPSPLRRPFLSAMRLKGHVRDVCCLNKLRAASR